MHSELKYKSMIGRRLYHTHKLYRNMQRMVGLRITRINQFSTVNKKDIDMAMPTLDNTEKFVFKTEIAKLLHIVAHSIYTDKDVFLRELLSNCSDAIEKQRYLEINQQSDSGTPHCIFIKTSRKRNQLIIEDTGIGMNREEMIDNLGNIANSGSLNFLKSIQNGETKSADIEHNLIGKFGIGFYSSFIIAKTVKVISKREYNEQAFVWESDGSGSFSISKTDSFEHKKGTRVILELKDKYIRYSDRKVIRAIIDKYSNFIQHDILLNDNKINLISALWLKDKREISDREYKKFYQYVAKKKDSYQFKIHYSIDVPITMTALLYFPKHSKRVTGTQKPEIDVHLYCRKILIKKSAKELLPSYLNFLKGVVDCEDLPLNISRENYQDSNLIVKVRRLLTKKVLRLLLEISRKDNETYIAWHNEFHFQLREGLHSDVENRELILELCRFDTSFGEDNSIEDYIQAIKPEQKEIYFFNSPNPEVAQLSPYMEPFHKNKIPVLYIKNSIEEHALKQLQNYKEYMFKNIEDQNIVIPNNLISKEQRQQIDKPRVPNKDIEPLNNWIRNELQPVVNTVVVTTRLSNSPAVVTSQYNSSFREAITLADKTHIFDLAKNLTMEINPEHNVIMKINRLRKIKSKDASYILKQLLDLCLLTIGIPFDIKVFQKRSIFILENSVEYDLKSIEKLGDQHSQVQVEWGLDQFDSMSGIDDILSKVEDLNKKDKKKGRSARLLEKQKNKRKR